MSIKNVKPTYKSGYKQGKYLPKNPLKYNGRYPIIYRSAWERKFCVWCDNNDNVIEWSSESISIKYFSSLDNKYHNYYPDFLIRVKEGDEIKNYIVEIKPKKHLEKPPIPKVKTKKAIKNYNWSVENYIRNYHKINALNEFCKNSHYEPMILTENSNIF